MMSDTACVRRFRGTAFVLAATTLAALAGTLITQRASARDGITECTTAEADGEYGPVWR